MNRPEMDTMHVPDGDKELTDAISEAPAPSRVWLSQLAMVVLLAAGVYAVIRGAQQYPATADEVHHLQGKLAQGEASLANASGTADAANSDWVSSVRTWRDKSAERHAVVRLHLLGCYGLMLLSPAAFVCALAVWWRGQFPRPGAKFPLDGAQIAMNATVLVLLAGLRIFDSATLNVMGRTPPVPDLMVFLKTPSKEERLAELAELKTKFEEWLTALQDEGKPEVAKKPDNKRPDPKKPDTRKPEVAAKKQYSGTARASIARAIGTVAWNKELLATLSEEDKKAYRAKLKDLARRNFADEESCPILIRAIAGLGDPAEAASLEVQREQSRPQWVDVKKPVGLKFLLSCVAAGREADVKKLIERGVPLNAYVPGEDHTPLHAAVGWGQAGIAELLISKGAKVEIAGRYARDSVEREQPLHRAAAVGDVALVKLLADKGANVMALDFRGMTPLHVAAASGNCDAAALLLKLKAKINHLDHAKRTPLDVAAESRSPAKAKMRDLLVQSGGLTSAELLKKPNTAEAAAK